jgi:CheY-like chemotaxis protein
MILLIDDDYESSATLKELLSRRGYVVRHAANAADALEWLADTNTPPSLVLLDLAMPVLDGWSFLNKRRADPRLAALPVLVMSSSREDTQNIIDAGGIGFVAKPINLRALLRVVRHFDKPMIHQR